MESVKDCLHLFGLRPGASWDEVNAAYRDLVRVWHPDRFHSDERLLKKANDQTAILNLAMQKLRSEYNPDSARPKPKTDSHASGPKTERPKPQPQSYQQGFDAEDRAERVQAFQLPPLLVKQRIKISLLRIIAASAVVALGFYTIGAGAKGSSQDVFGCALTLFAISAVVKNACVMVVRRPLIRVDSKGIATYDFGILGWGEIQRVWTTLSAGSYCLALNCSPGYLTARNWASKGILRVRKLIRGAHYVVRCAGLDAHPNDVIRAVNAQHLTGHIDPTGRQAIPDSTSAQWARLVGVLAALALMLRSALGHNLTQIDYGFYFGVFAMCQAYDIAHRLMRLPKDD
jgi:hypothetical protein